MSLRELSSYVGSVVASRVHHDRKVQFGLRNRSAKPSQMDERSSWSCWFCCSSLLWDVVAVLTVTTQARLLFFVCLEVVRSNGRFKLFGNLQSSR